MLSCSRAPRLTVPIHSVPPPPRRAAVISRCQATPSNRQEDSKDSQDPLARRAFLAAAAACIVAAPSVPASAIQGATAGRLPGESCMMLVFMHMLLPAHCYANKDQSLSMMRQASLILFAADGYHLVVCKKSNHVHPFRLQQGDGACPSLLT